MRTDYENRLRKSVIRFKKTADKNFPKWNELNDNGEWELDLNEFDEMCSIIIEIIKKLHQMKPHSRCLMIYCLVLQGIMNAAA